MPRVSRWKLPLSLGGKVVPGSISGWKPSGEAFVEVVLDDGSRVDLPEAMLIELRPVQPEQGWVIVAVTATDNRTQLWHVFHRELGWDTGTWFHHDTQQHMSWDQLCEFGEPRLMTQPPPQAGVRATCPVCGENRALRIDGTFKQHGSKDSQRACKGTGQLPGGA